MIRVVVVDDHPVVCSGIAAIIDDDPNLFVAAQAHSGREAVEAAGRVGPDVAIVDQRLTDTTGAALCEVLLARDSTLRVVIATSFANETTMLTAFAAGAKGFLVKDAEPSVLRQAVRAVARGGTFIDPRMAGSMVDLATYGGRGRGFLGLTMQEVRVVQCLPRGMSNREIGRHLHVSPETVKTHLRNAKRKLGATSRANAAAIAIRRGLA